MKIIINSSSMVPIYEQIMDQIKAQITAGDLRENDVLPSVRTLAKDLKISALTVKKAYDNLEQEGYTVTVHGKGPMWRLRIRSGSWKISAGRSRATLKRRSRRGAGCGLKDEEIRELFDLIMED